MTRKAGFTLTELLIALILLGVIAAFSIPKVLKATADQRGASLVRETVASFEDLYYSTRMNPGITATAGVSFFDLIGNQFNGVMSATEATAPTTADASTDCVDTTNIGSAWVKFPNGVVVTGIGGAGTGQNLNVKHAFCIDTDGATGTGTTYVGNFTHAATGRTFNWETPTALGGTGTLVTATRLAASAVLNP